MHTALFICSSPCQSTEQIKLVASWNWGPERDWLYTDTMRGLLFCWRWCELHCSDSHKITYNYKNNKILYLKWVDIIVCKWYGIFTTKKNCILLALTRTINWCSNTREYREKVKHWHLYCSWVCLHLHQIIHTQRSAMGPVMVTVYYQVDQDAFNPSLENLQVDSHWYLQSHRGYLKVRATGCWLW